MAHRGVFQESEQDVLEGYNSVRTFSSAEQKQFAEQFRAAKAKDSERPSLDGSSEYNAPENYDDRLDHFHNFFTAIRGGKPVIEDAIYGLRAAAPALLTNNSYIETRVVSWDPEGMKMLS